MRNYKDVIRSLMRDRKWSNVKLADKTGLAKNYISELITDGKRPNPSFETLEAIAHAFGESVSVFTDEPAGSSSDEIESEWQEWIEMLIIVLKSKHRVFSTAIQANLAAFSSSIGTEDENLRLKAENEKLKSQQKDTDFKTTPRKKQGSTA